MGAPLKLAHRSFSICSDASTMRSIRRFHLTSSPGSVIRSPNRRPFPRRLCLKVCAFFLTFEKGGRYEFPFEGGPSRKSDQRARCDSGCVAVLSLCIFADDHGNNF